MDKQDTKTTLLEAGLELFALAPYEGVSVQDIVDHVHVTKPTLYHHFKSKLGFYQAIFDTYAMPFLEIVRQKSAFQHDFVNNLNELAEASLKFFIENPNIFWLLEYASNVSVHAEHYDYIMNFWRNFIQTIENLFEQAVVQHGNLRGKTSMTSWLFIHAIRAEIHAVLKEHQVYTPDLPYKLVHQFMYGIFA